MKNKKFVAMLTATMCCACSVSATINPFISMADDNSVENIINIEYTFDDVYSMTTEEVASIFAEKGLTQDNGYYVYGQGEDAEYISNHECGVYLFSTDFLLNQTVEELADKYPSRIQGICLYDTNEIIWNEEKICHSLDLPEEFFDVTVFTRRINVKGVDSTDKYMFSCECEIKCKIFDEKEYAAMRNALLNYVQLRSDFDALYIEEEILNYDKENEVIQKNAEAIVEYFYNNDIKGGVSIALPSEVITVVYYGEYEDQIKAYIAELGIDENMIVYEPHALSDYIGMDLDDIMNPSIVKGDANCDGQLDMADAVLIMQALANPNKYGLDGTADNCLTEQGKINGDVDGNGLTVGDAQAIQKKLLGLDKDDIDETAIIGKTYLYDENDNDGGFTITFPQ